MLADVRRELIDGRGIVMMQNFPIERFDREAQAIAYLGIGAYLGDTMSQNAQGHILGHVKDLGGDYADPNTRGYMTRAEMLFHADACDYVGLLCLQRRQERRRQPGRELGHGLQPDAGAAARSGEGAVRGFLPLAQRRGESRASTPWFKQPIFSFTDGYFSATGAGAAIDKAQTAAGRAAV